MGRRKKDGVIHGLGLRCTWTRVDKGLRESDRGDLIVGLIDGDI